MLRRFLFVWVWGLSAAVGQAAPPAAVGACRKILEGALTSPTIAAKKYRHVVCGQLREWRNDANFRKVEKFVERKFRETQHIREFTSACVGMAPAAVLAEVYSYSWDGKDPQTRNWFSLHGSNLVEGMYFMTAVHCVGQAWLKTAGTRENARFIRDTPQTANALLATVLGLNVAGNFWEEVDLGLPEQRSLPLFSTSGNKVQTDLEDFKSGMLATIAYLTIVKAFEMKSPQFRCD